MSSDQPTILAAQDAADHIAQLREELDHIKRELDHTQRLATLGVLAAGIAHEINNILTPVLAYAQLAASNPGDAKLHAKAIDRAIHGVQSATQIAEAMLGFASNGEQSDSANIADTVKAALECIGRDPSKDRVNINLKIPPHLSVNMKPLSLQQVMMNLILNAIAALKSKGGTLTITAQPDGNGTVQLQVRDTGPGIPREVAGRLFEPFAHHATSSSRSISTGSKQKSGTGLGLAICRRLVEEAGGQITARSSAEDGTTFTITLPTERISRAKAG